MNKPISTRIGELFAHVQDLFDTMIHTAIKRVDENDKLDKNTGKIVGFIPVLETLTSISIKISNLMIQISTHSI